jgi:hypothetical protein
MNNKDLHQIKEKLAEGYFPQWLVTDPDIFKLEQEKNIWHYMAVFST